MNKLVFGISLFVSGIIGLIGMVFAEITLRKFRLDAFYSGDSRYDFLNNLVIVFQFVFIALFLIGLIIAVMSLITKKQISKE